MSTQGAAADQKTKEINVTQNSTIVLGLLTLAKSYRRYPSYK